MGIGKSLEKKIEQSAHRRSVDIISVLVEITKYPCAKIGKIAQNLNTTPGTVRWYLKKLCNEKILVCKKEAGRSIYFIYEQIDEKDIPVITFLQNEDVHAVITIIHKKGGGLSKREIISALPLDNPTKIYTYENLLNRMVHLDLLTVLKDRKMNYYYPGDRIAALHAKYAAREQKVSDFLVKKISQLISPEVQIELVQTKRGYVIVHLTQNNKIEKEHNLYTNPLWAYSMFIPEVQP